MKPVSRLDAFSVYQNRTRLPSYALGRTTGAPEVSLNPQDEHLPIFSFQLDKDGYLSKHLHIQHFYLILYKTVFSQVEYLHDIP